MTDFDNENGATRDDLLQRVALMETMIAEGRKTTTRFGWVFVLWGVMDMVGIGWQHLQPHSHWVWPITLSTAVLLQVTGVVMLKGTSHSCGTSMQSRSVGAVWSMMGIGTMLYVAAAIVRHLTWQVTYLAAILMLIGLAHAISAVILRWPGQGAVAALWWAGGIAMYFVPGHGYRLSIFTAEMFFGMVIFGLYAVMLDRRSSTTPVQRHA